MTATDSLRERLNSRLYITENNFFNPSTRTGIYLTEISDSHFDNNTITYDDSVYVLPHRSTGLYYFVRMRYNYNSTFDDNKFIYKDKYKFNTGSHISFIENAYCTFDKNTIQITDDVTLSAASYLQFSTMGSLYECSIQNNKLDSEKEIEFLQAFIYSVQSTTTTKRTWSGSAWIDTVVTDVLNTPPGAPSNYEVYIVGSNPSGVWFDYAEMFATWITDHYSYNDITGHLWTDPQVKYYDLVNPKNPSTGDAYALSTGGMIDNVINNNDWDVRNKLTIPINSTAWFRLDGNGVDIIAGNEWEENAQFAPRYEDMYYNKDVRKIRYDQNYNVGIGLNPYAIREGALNSKSALYFRNFVDPSITQNSALSPDA